MKKYKHRGDKTKNNNLCEQKVNNQKTLKKSHIIFLFTWSHLIYVCTMKESSPITTLFE